MAKRSDYLMHNLLALSAVHSARLRPHGQPYYRNLAAFHQSKAASGFRLSVQSLSAENSSIICASAGITLLTELGYSLIPGNPSTPRDDPILELLHRFALVRTTVSLWQSSLPFIYNDHRTMALFNHDKTFVPHKVPVKIAKALEKLGQLPDGLSMQANDRSVYKRAIESLYSEFSIVITQPRDFGQILRWGNLVDQRFLDLTSQKDPMALVILAHYCMLLYHATTRWCLDGWAERVYDAVNASLDESWICHLGLAAEAMETEPFLKFPEEACCPRKVDNIESARRMGDDELQFWASDHSGSSEGDWLLVREGVRSMGDSRVQPYRSTMVFMAENA